MILEVGFVSQLPEVQKSLMRNGVYGTGEKEFLKIFEASFLSQQTSASPTTIGNRKWESRDIAASSHLLTGLEPIKLDSLYKSNLGSADTFTWHTDARFSLLLSAISSLASSSSTTSSSTSSITETLKSASGPEFRSIVTSAILERLGKLLFISSEEMDPAKAVSEYGMD
ncbi:MAG: hypothetical protein Q9168_006741, partial [Polycauliona sp. 1 TL-2023]